MTTAVSTGIGRGMKPQIIAATTPPVNSNQNRMRLNLIGFYSFVFKTATRSSASSLRRTAKEEIRDEVSTTAAAKEYVLG